MKLAVRCFRGSADTHDSLRQAVKRFDTALAEQGLGVPNRWHFGDHFHA